MVVMMLGIGGRGGVKRAKLLAEFTRDAFIGLTLVLICKL